MSKVVVNRIIERDIQHQIRHCQTPSFFFGDATSHNSPKKHLKLGYFVENQESKIRISKKTRFVENQEDKDFPPPKKWLFWLIFSTHFPYGKCWGCGHGLLWGFPFFLDGHHDGPPHFEFFALPKTTRNSQIRLPPEFLFEPFFAFKRRIFCNEKIPTPWIFSGFVWGGASLASRRIST